MQNCEYKIINAEILMQILNVESSCGILMQNPNAESECRILMQNLKAELLMQNG